jgi:subtilisin family serine protease
MKPAYRVIFLFLPLLFLFSNIHAVKIEKLSFMTPQGLAKSKEVVSGQAFIKFSKKVSSETKKQLLKGVGAEKIKDIDFIGWTLVKIPKGMKVSGGIKSLKKLKNVEFVEPNNVYRPSIIPNDILISPQYSLSQIKAFAAWEYETGFSSRVTVAVMDTGIDGTNTELSGKLTGIAHQFFDPNNAGAQSDDTPPIAACNHATRVAGISAASSNNSSGIAGISWGAKLLSLRVFDTADCTSNCGNVTSDSCVTDDTAMIAAINYVASINNSTTTGRIVLNMSIGGPPPCVGPIQTAINVAEAAGIVIVAAAGNDGADNNINSPACCTYVIPAGATDSSDELAYFSTKGPEMTNRGLVAPGVSVYTTDLSNGFAYADGTSFSSPGIAGLAALILSADPTLIPSDVGDFMRDGADDLGIPGDDSSYGHGRINMVNSLQLVIDGKLSNLAEDQKAIVYPNPFYISKNKILTFAIPSKIFPEFSEIKIYNMEGELVRKVDGMTWDGRNHVGNAVASGIYIFRMKTDEKTFQGKFAVIR